MCGAGQHIPRIERAIRVVKERTRCFWMPLPFKRVSKIMIDECLYIVILCLNSLPHPNGISKILSPATIVLGRGKVNGNNLKAIFDRYYEVYAGTDNTNRERRVSAICLHPSNNQGGYYFMSIETRKRIHGYNFTQLAMTEHIIDRVHSLTDNENAPALDDDGCPTFEWELGTPFPSTNNPVPPTDAPAVSDDNLSLSNDSYVPASDNSTFNDIDLSNDTSSGLDDESISD